MKNCEPFVLGPELAIEIIPAPNKIVKSELYKMTDNVSCTTKIKNN